MLVFTNKKTWATECAKRGAVNHLSEINTYDDLGQEHMQEYAVCSGNRGLCGVWNPVKRVTFILNHVKLSLRRTASSNRRNYQCTHKETNASTTDERSA